MYSQQYEKYKKEFINCLVMSPVGLGLPLFNAFREWWPKMQAEKEKALAGGQPEEPVKKK